jgi:hypothetical protein
MAISLLGSDEIQSTAASGSQSVTVPGGTNFIVVGMGGFNNTTNMFSGGTFTIGGNALTSLLPALDDADDTQAIALYYRVNPGTGSLTFAWSVSGGAPDEGVIYQFGFYSGVDTSSPWRDSGGEATVDEATASTGVLDVESGDWAILVGCGNDASGSWGASPSTTINEREENALNFAIVSLADAQPTADTDFTFTPNASYAACAVGILKPFPATELATTVAGSSSVSGISGWVLKPTGEHTITNVVNEGDDATNLYASIDDDPSLWLSTSADTDYINNGSNSEAATQQAFFALTDMPPNFAGMDSLIIFFRYRGTNFWGSPTISVYAQVFQSDESSALTDEELVQQLTGNGAFGTGSVAFSGVVASNTATWNGARLRLRWVVDNP